MTSIQQNFEDVWATIVARIHVGDEIKNWGKVRNYTGRTFRIERVHNSRIGVFGGKMTGARDIAKDDFAKVYSVWDQYVAGNYPRATMISLSQNTTYILSIFQHVIGS